jgi:hypothetical protein
MHLVFEKISYNFVLYSVSPSVSYLILPVQYQCKINLDLVLSASKLSLVDVSVICCSCLCHRQNVPHLL